MSWLLGSRPRSTRTRLVAATVATLAALCGAADAARAVGFSLQVIDPKGPSRVWGKGVGDLNGDGRADVVIGSYDGGLYWYENPGWTKRTISRSYRIEEDMEIADLTHDGRKDVVAITTAGVVLFENGKKGWSARTLVKKGPDLHDIELVDLDRNGTLDIVGRPQGGAGKTIYLWRQTTLANWQGSTIALPAGGEGLEVADIDRNGRPDIVVGKYWLRNNGIVSGKPSFTRYLYGSAAPANAYIAVADVNKDGRLDIVASPAWPPGGRHDMAWFAAPAQPTGGWTRHVLEAAVETGVHFTGVGDFDRNGQADIVTAMVQGTRNPRIKIYANITATRAAGTLGTVAATSSHSMKLLTVGGKPSLLGADYNNAGATPIKLWKAGG
ncbi:MAG: FG-GAP repeat domain-containing protein [Geminicoccaceae bacterium]